MNRPSDWRIWRPNDTIKQRDPASDKIFCLQESKHSRDYNVQLEDFDFCKDERKAKRFAEIQMAFSIS